MGLNSTNIWDQLWLPSSLSLSFSLSLLHRNRQACLAGHSSRHCALSVCGRHSIHYVWPTHTISLHGSVPHAQTHTNANKATRVHTQRSEPTDTWAFSEIPEMLHQGPRCTPCFLGKLLYLVTVLTCCSRSLSFSDKQIRGGAVWDLKTDRLTWKWRGVKSCINTK